MTLFVCGYKCCMNVRPDVYYNRLSVTTVQSNIENKCSESVDSGLKPSQDASGNNLATCAITVKCQTLDDSQAVMQDGH